MVRNLGNPEPSRPKNAKPAPRRVSESSAERELEAQAHGNHALWKVFQLEQLVLKLWASLLMLTHWPTFHETASAQPQNGSFVSAWPLLAASVSQLFLQNITILQQGSSCQDWENARAVTGGGGGGVYGASETTPKTLSSNPAIRCQSEFCTSRGACAQHQDGSGVSNCWGERSICHAGRHRNLVCYDDNEHLEIETRRQAAARDAGCKTSALPSLAESRETGRVREHAT